MTITKKILSLAMVVVLSLNGCADLDVGNTNAPDQARALASPEDVVFDKEYLFVLLARYSCYRRII